MGPVYAVLCVLVNGICYALRRKERRSALACVADTIAIMPHEQDARPAQREPVQLPTLDPPEQFYADANQRGIGLLVQNLSAAQREQYRWYDSFDVIGGVSGKHYRIRHGHVQNVDELNAHGDYVCCWCFAPVGELVAGDVMLVQKLALELFETEAIRIANRYDGRPD